MKDIVLTSKEDLTHLIESSIRKIFKEELKNANSSQQVSKNEIVFLEEAIVITGLAKPTLYAKTSKNEIPHYKRGRKLYFKRSELLAWIEEGKQ